jgi:hypothetical protein
MTGNLTSHVMRERIDDQLRVAAERRRAGVGASPERSDAGDAHDRQLALVLASLLFSRRRDVAAHRRGT